MSPPRQRHQNLHGRSRESHPLRRRSRFLRHMGNYLSCSCSCSGGSAIVFLPGGESRRFGLTVSVAELMLDAPGHFVASADTARVGSRFAALAADEKVEMGGVYVMVPLTRMGSVVTPADMAGLRMAPGGGNVAPAAVAPVEEERVRTEGRLGKVEGMDEMELRRMINKCRSRKPSLETIAEENATAARGRRKDSRG